ncbi:MAG TPA: CerR family C-terminal domain-containing protein [Steroidobacteraceae bacterium]|nr:CerR family C-terminal domain-containing protein [Steroidobacteraceae bacterium]
MPRATTRAPKRRRLRRHPAGGGYAPGARTRRRIMEAAIVMFASLGYERTSTRAIARRAGVSLPALQYYFGGKEGLQRACGEYIAMDVHTRLAPAAARVRAALAAPRLSRSELIALLRAVLDPFVEAMATERPESWVLFLTRAQAERSAAFDALFERVAGGMIGLAAEIVARILDRPRDDPQVLIRALSVVGQMALVRRGREFMLRALGWPDFSGRRLALLKESLWQQIERGLGGE